MPGKRVVHGNRYNARKKVHFIVQREGSRLALTVEDEGDGFDMPRCQIRWPTKICYGIPGGGSCSFSVYG